MTIDLKTFLFSKMKMSGPYQLMVIKTLLQHEGKVSLQKVAESCEHKEAYQVVG